MSIYGELDPMAGHRISNAFNGKREHIAKVNLPNMAYPGQHIDIEIPHGSRDHVIVQDTFKIMFKLDIASTDKARSVVNNVGRAPVKKKELILGSKSIDTINNSDIYDTYKAFLERKRTWREVTSRHTVGQWFKGTVGWKKTNGTALTLATQENAVKKTFDNRFAIPLDFDFFKHPMYPCGLRENLIARLELNSAGKVILCTGHTSETFKLSGISLEYDAIFDEPYATARVKCMLERGSHTPK